MSQWVIKGIRTELRPLRIREARNALPASRRGCLAAVTLAPLLQHSSNVA